MSERDIFLALLDLTVPAERARYLDEACAGDPELRAKVERLIHSHEAAGSFLDLSVDPTRQFVAPDDGSTHAHGEPHGEPHDDDTDDALCFLSPAQRPDSLGRIGHYEVLEVLGRGGFGVVFRAFDDVLQRVVAVKVLAPSMAATSPARKRFLREARSAALIQHENVVRIHETGEEPLPYLVMEFVPGETLQQRLDRSGPLEVPEVLAIGRQIAAGLEAAHEKGLIHRDIKPSNILIDSGPHQRVTITDFGLARAADDASLTRSGVVAGTPMYMAPEQAKGETLDRRADLFSLGSVLYAILTGHPPFRAPNTPAVLKRVAEDDPRSMREVIPEIPEWLCRIVEKLHAKDPAGRFQTASEVAELLADCEMQLETDKQLTNFSRIPGAEPKPRLRRFGRPLHWVAATIVVLAGLFIWFGRSAALYLSDQGELTFLPGEGLVSVIVLQNDEGDLYTDKAHTPVTDWLGMKEKQSLTLPPGRYQVNVSTYPLGRVVSQWEVTTSGAFGSSRTEVPVIRSSAIVTVGRGQRVTLRPLMSGTPPPPVTTGRLVVTVSDPGVRLELSNEGEVKTTRSIPTQGTAGVIFDDHLPVGEWNVAAYRGPADGRFHSVIKLGPEGRRIVVPAFDTLKTAAGSGDGFVPLFNGKNTDGWLRAPVEPGKLGLGDWRVQDGVLEARTTFRDYLFTQRGDYRNFHLVVEAKMNAGGDGGLLFRCEHGLTSKFNTAHGYETELGDLPNVPHGSLWTGPEGPNNIVPAKRTLSRAGKWFTQEAIVRGGHVVVKLDGEEVLNYHANPEHYTHGHIALQVWGEQTELSVRKVEIQELPASAQGKNLSALDRDDLAKLRGEWVSRGAEVAGEPVSLEDEAFVVRFGEGEFVLQHTTKTVATQTGTFEIDAAKKQVLLKFKGQTVPTRVGYRFENDRLQLNFAGLPNADVTKGPPRRIAERLMSLNNVKFLAVALLNFSDFHKALPRAALRDSKDKAGKPLLSWRVALLPWVEQGDLYKRFKLDEPWDSEHNKKLIPLMPMVYAAPGIDTPGPGMTHYRVFVGPGTVFEAKPDREHGIRFAEMADGPANTLLLAEAAEPVVWTKPDELLFGPDTPLPKLGLYGAGAHIALCDGKVQTLSAAATDKAIRALITRSGGESEPIPFLSATSQASTLTVVFDRSK